MKWRSEERGFLKVLDEQNVVPKVESEADYEALTRDLDEKFGSQVFMERL